ncbi:hypothetical protein [Achromobacter xylosoxidans]|uniref:hypothetical protein n=1 Tax=Alcaligenes xylosoxydans xylosoxydans TaxID=85698 RepID=UPI000ACB5806|nr:hypothetical protein [Achromobacter xylosoxidans]
MAYSRNGKSSTATESADLIQWKRITPPLAKLHLDLHNPRHEPVSNEDEAIAWLYDKEKVEALAKDIVEKKAMSPFDNIGVIAMSGNPGHFIAVEGNRRLCALLLLNDPERAPTPSARELLLALSKQIRLPPRVEVIQFNSRDDSKHWIELRHLGPQDGQGLVGWNTTQKERAAGGGVNALAVAVLDRAREGQWYDIDKLPAVTTLTRYLNNREVRAALGLGHPRQLIYTHAQEEVDAALRQFLMDAMAKNDDSTPLVHSRSKDRERSRYAEEFRTRGGSPRTPLEEPLPPKPALPPKDPGSRGPRNLPDPAKRQFLVPTGFVCNAPDKNLRMLFQEMRRTQIDDHEFANAYLLRALIERIMVLYLATVDRGYTPKDDQALVARCAEMLDPTRKAPKFKAMRIAVSDQHAAHSLHTLGAAVHTGYMKPRRDLISAWANWEVALKEMLEVISTKP